MNTANNQTQNLNYNPHNPNFTNPGSKKFARDYDKEPLVIKSYERFFAYTIFFVPMMLAGLFIYLFTDYGAYTSKEEYISLASVISAVTAVVYFFTAVRAKHEVKFTNKHIEFISNGIVKRRCWIDKEELGLCFTLDGFNEGRLKMPVSDNIFFLVMALMMLIAWQGMAIAMVFFMYLGNVIFKLIIYLFLNKSLRGFRFLPFLRVAVPWYGNNFKAFPISMKYFSIYIYNEKVYEEIWRWFLQNGVNIDRVKRNYMFI